MNLDDTLRFQQIDTQNMLAEIDNLPHQLQYAWECGQAMPLPNLKDIDLVVIAGMGGSAIGGDLLAAYTAPSAKIPLIVWRDYGLPAFATGPKTLVAISSHSGNTEEVLAAFDRGLNNQVNLLAITTGGELARRAEANGITLWRFEHAGQPRAAVGFSFGYLLALLARLNQIPDPSQEVTLAVEAMIAQQKHLTADRKVSQNPAKRLAGKMINHWPVVLGADALAPVARRWRTQIAELSKAVAQFEELPEADHNMVAGVLQPESLITNTLVVLLRSKFNHPRNQRRIEVTRKILMRQGFGTDIFDASGGTRLAQQWTSLHFGDYMAYYLAMCYENDPTPVDAIEDLKLELKN